MHISHLGLTNFRNFARLEIDLPEGPIVLLGDNGHGKSNFLEAVFFLATTRSPYASADRQLIHWLAWKEQQPFARLTARVEREKGPLRVEIVLKGRPLGDPWTVQEPESPGVSKRVRLNQIPRRALDALGEFQVVMFCPQDVNLVAGSPSERRRYLDVANSQLDSRYARSLSQLNRVLLQRNSLLRRIREEGASQDQLEFWDQQLIDFGTYVIQQRGRFVAEVGPLANQEHQRLAGGPKILKVTYLSALGQKEPLGPEDLDFQSLTGRLSAALKRERAREIASGMSLVGPQRDDLQFTVDGVEMTAYGSRGEQRTIALALKLAEVSFFRYQTGDRPVLLLDDVLSELDPARRSHLLAYLPPEQQAIVTTTDLSGCPEDFLRQAHILDVREGQIEMNSKRQPPTGLR